MGVRREAERIRWSRRQSSVAYPASWRCKKEWSTWTWSIKYPWYVSFTSVCYYQLQPLSRIKGKKSGEVKMIKNGDLVEAHQASNIVLSTWLMTYEWHSSGTAPTTNGRRSVTSSMLLDQVVNSYTKGRNTIMYSMSISKMEFHHSNCRIMSLVASILIPIIEHLELISWI